MASHHHNHGGCRRHRHNHRETIPHEPPFNYATSPPCCCADSSPCCNQSNHHPSPPNLDHLVRLIASYLQNQQQTQRFNAEYDNLLRKVDHLDLSLSRFAACYDDKRRFSYHSKLKDSAARVIQTHFRSYLVHRSISLRQLKELATLKSNFLSLRSSVSGKTHFPYQAVSRQATDLLHRIDSIQGRVDSMIRDGKGSLRRDVVRFLHYIDDFAAKRRHIVCKSAKDVSFTGQERRFVSKRHVGEERIPEKSRRKMGTTHENIVELQEFHFTSDDDAQHIPLVSVKKSRKVGSLKSRVGELAKGDKVKNPVTKTVMFGKNRNVYELSSSAEDDSFDDGEEILMISRDGAGRNSRSESRSRSGVVTKGSGVKKRVMKTVSFDENGNLYKVYGDTPETSVTEGDGDSTSGSNNSNGDPYNEVEDIKYVPKENEGLEESAEEEEEEEEEEETHSENEEEPSSEGSKEEEQVTENVGKQEHKREFQPRKGSSMFSPPLPLKMEP